MGGTVPNITILELKVQDNAIWWSVRQGGLDGLSAPVQDSQKEEFDLDEWQSQTIECLVEALQFLFLNDLLLDKELAGGGALELFKKLVITLGEYLYMVLFRGRIHEELLRFLQAKDASLLRIQLEFEGSQDARLSSWPWEYLRIPQDKHQPCTGQFLAQVAELMLNRKLSLGRVPALSTREEVRVLVVASSPKYNGRPKALTPVEASAVTHVIETLVKSLKEQGISIRLEELVEPEFEFSDAWKPTVTWQAFQQKVAAFQPHIIHFIGHGQRDPKGGGLVAFVKAGGEADWQADEKFAKWAADSRDLKLVFLQVCESALPDPHIGISGVARCLAHQNIPAVVAMQYKVEKQVADTFAASFYSSLAEGNPIDLAVKAGRDAIAGLPDSGQQLAFGLPVLYLRDYAGMIRRQAAGSQASRSPSLHEVQPDQLKCPYCKTFQETAREWCSNEECALPLVCPHCKTRIKKATQQTCTGCGLRLICEECGQPLLDPLGRFCDCGRQIDWPRPTGDT